MNRVKFEQEIIDERPEYVSKIVEAVINLADCIEVFVLPQESKSVLETKTNSLQCEIAAADAGATVKKLISPTLEQHALSFNSTRVSVPLYEMRKELRRIYEACEWDDWVHGEEWGNVPPSDPLPTKDDLSGVPHRLRSLARMLAFATKPSPSSTAEETVVYSFEEIREFAQQIPQADAAGDDKNIASPWHGPSDEPSEEYRNDGLEGGELLTANFLNKRFNIKSPYLSKHVSELNGRMKYGRSFVYLWKDVLALSEKRDVNLKK